MDIGLFGRGLLVGVSIAAPVGPIGVLCIRRTLTLGTLAGLVSGLGAATADAIYGAIAAYGLTAISGILVGQSFWFRLVGGVFLIYLGVQTGLAKPATKPAEVGGLTNAQGLAGAYFSTVILTITNPATIMSFAAVFAGLGLGGAGLAGATSSQSDRLAAITLVVGVFVGSALWWLLLSSVVSLFRSVANPNTLQWLNRVSGVVLIMFGVIALISLGHD